MITAKDLRQMIFTMSLIKPECINEYLEETASRFNDMANGTRRSKNKPVVTSIAHVAVRGVRGRVLGEPTLK